MRRKGFIFILLMFFLLPANSFGATASISLKDVMQVSNILLTGKYSNSEEYDYKISIPERWKVKYANLSFAITNSSALVRERSVLVVHVAGIPVEQIILDPRRPSRNITVRIPGSLLKPGYHSLQFDVTQYSRQGGCEDPQAPELWTMVMLKDAKIDFNYNLKKVPERISAINEFIFDPKNPNAPDVNLVFNGIKSGLMKTVAVCASGVAIRYDYRPVHFVAEGKIKTGMDNIIIGDEEFVNKKIKEAGFKKKLKIKGPLISVLSAPEKVSSRFSAEKGNLRFAMVIVSGRDEKEIYLAAKSFSLISLPFPDRNQVIIENTDISKIDSSQNRNTLTPGNIYSLGGLNFKTKTFRGMIPIPKGFSFKIPSDLNLTPDRHAILSLNIAYGASMRKDSVLNIELNDKFVAAIPCDEPDGGTFKLYKVRIAANILQPGFNKINFVPQLSTFSADKCSLIQQGNLRVTIFDDSTFSLPLMDKWIEMADLSALMIDGYPFSSDNELDKTFVAIPDKTTGSFIAAVNLISILSQKTGIPPFKSEWGFSVPESIRNNVIVVSTSDKIPERLAEKAPLNLRLKGNAKYPHMKRPMGKEDNEQKGILPRLFSSEKSSLHRYKFQDLKFVTIRMSPLLISGRAALTEFQNPNDTSGTVLIFASGSEKDMIKGGKALWDRGFQASCKGDTVLINLMKKEVETLSLKMGSSYYLGEVSSVPMVDYYANSYPLWFVFLIVLICLVISFLLYKILKKRKMRRHRDAQTL